jgi:hypothetical protein
MKTPLTFLLSLTFLFLFSGSVYGDDFQDGLDAYDRVAVIAHSISTSTEARRIMSNMKWTKVERKNADYILVVCRSGLSFPLNSAYDSIKELDEDADNQLNISGSNMHVYVYQINDDLSVDENKHKYWETDE